MSEKTTAHPSAFGAAFSDIGDIIADIRAGKMVIMVDDENRENEGDLLMAASKVRAEDVNYMATHGRGLICLTLSRERCAQLRLPLSTSSSADTRIGRCSGLRRARDRSLRRARSSRAWSLPW